MNCRSQQDIRHNPTQSPASREKYTDSVLHYFGRKVLLNVVPNNHHLTAEQCSRLCLRVSHWDTEATGYELKKRREKAEALGRLQLTMQDQDLKVRRECG